MGQTPIALVARASLSGRREGAKRVTLFLPREALLKIGNEPASSRLRIYLVAGCETARGYCTMAENSSQPR